MTEPLTNTIDMLMSIDPLELTKDDLRGIVAYYRNLRAMKEEGKGKAARAKQRADGPKLDIQALLGSMVKTTPSGPVIKRRV